MNNEEADNCSQPSACEQATPIASNSVRARKTIRPSACKQAVPKASNSVRARKTIRPSTCKQATPIASNSVRASKTIKKPTTMQRKTNKCGVCKKMMRSDSLKRHLIKKHSTILTSNQVKKVVWDARPYKDYHKSTTCSVCGKVMRSDYLKKHMIAKHQDVLSTVDAVKKQSTPNGKTSFSAYDRKVNSSTSCALTTVTSALHWAFKHIHDETVTILERNGERDASKRITNLLVPVEEELANMIDQELFRVANVLILEQPKPNRYESEQLY